MSCVACIAAILRKPGRFTPEEFNVMKTHAAEGAKIVHNILKDTDDVEFHIIAENVAHYHHERVDGLGYYGLKGKKIPIIARILAILDTFSAVTVLKSYKPARSYEDGITALRLGAGSQFDEDLVEKFVAIPKARIIECYEEVDKEIESLKTLGVIP